MPAAVIAGEAMVPRLVLKPTCVGAATTLPTPSRSVAVTLPIAPQAIDAGPLTVMDAGVFGAGTGAPGVTVSTLLTVASSWLLACVRSGVNVTCTPIGPVAAATVAAPG